MLRLHIYLIVIIEFIIWLYYSLTIDFNIGVYYPYIFIILLLLLFMPVVIKYNLEYILHKTFYIIGIILFLFCAPILILGIPYAIMYIIGIIKAKSNLSTIIANLNLGLMLYMYIQLILINRKILKNKKQEKNLSNI